MKKSFTIFFVHRERNDTFVNEFQKPYEYEEETGVIWPVRIFCILLLSVEMFTSIIYLVQLYKYVGGIPVIGTVAITLSFLYKAFVLVTLISLFSIKRYALKLVKAFLITRLIYLVITTVVIFVYTINDKNAIGYEYGQFQSVRDIIVMVLVTPLVYAIGFSISWYIYFCKSKRVKEVYR